MKITHASTLNNVSVLTDLAHTEREATVALIVHLAEFDSRGLYAGLGFQSTWAYCMEVLRLSEDATCNRIEAARMVRKYPIVLDMLETGTLSPTTARLLAKRLTDENHEALLAEASGKSKRQVEELLARHFPESDVRASVRRVSGSGAGPVAAQEPPAPAPALAESQSRMDSGSPSRASSSPTASAPALSAAPRPVVRSLAPERYEIRFTASAETCEKLRLAQDLLGHAVPSGDLAQVFDRALDVLVQELVKRKFAVTERPRPNRGQSDDSRNIPADVKRTVFVKDRGSCAFVSPSGRRCGSRRFLEFHHVEPYGAGGKPTAHNIQLRCGVHNRYEAELFYGPGKRCEGGDQVREAEAVYRCAVEFTRPGTGERSRAYESTA
ncbi:MAG: hypothetical protein DMF77_07850 [Acidobacteria bacterium]|nr:MAG: hypothetical protein DMF77_07850 [Acidobacteriota bacterium]